MEPWYKIVFGGKGVNRLTKQGQKRSIEVNGGWQDQSVNMPTIGATPDVIAFHLPYSTR